MRKYSAIFLLLFLLVFSSEILGKETTDEGNNVMETDKVNISDNNQQNTNVDSFTAEKNENDVSKKYSLKDESQEPFKEIAEENINKRLSAIEGKIEENAILSLDECIKKALANNPKIKSAFHNTEIYKTKITQAKSNYFPVFTMTNGISRNRYFTINFTVEDQMYTFYNTIDLSITQLLYDFGKTKARADMAKYNWEATVANLDETINETIYNVKKAYYNLIYALEKKKVYEDSVKTYTIQLNQAELYYKTGKKSKIDVTSAKYNLGNAKLGLIQSENEIILALAELSSEMGLPEYENYKISGELIFKKYDYKFEELMKNAIENRPELKIYENQIKASEQLIRAAKKSFTPNFELYGRFQDGGGTSLSDDYGWTIGAQFRCTNYNLLLMKKQLDEARATLKRDIAELEIRKNNLHLEVKQAYIKLKNAESSIPITELSLKQAQEQHKLAMGRYKAGMGDAIELKDSENTYKNAKLDYIYSILQYKLASAEIERVVGSKLNATDDTNEQTEVHEIIE